ncbi:uncharacterized protein [Littorina saxatilis]|uniref:uncharacterized protein n=1 Tax=Littorina saxatilis TaxID=31220 RepID=UPI0038B47882
MADGQSVKKLRIDNCNERYARGRYIDILENANNTILCRGFYPNDTVVWEFGGPEIGEKIATCDPSNCTVHQPDHFAVERSPSHSTLFYQQYDRQVDAGAVVWCSGHLGQLGSGFGCPLNAINPAKLSRCTVEEDRDNGTVRGSCRFDDAFSYRRAFRCTWYQEKYGQSKQFIGNIEYNNGSQSPGGECTFTSTNTTWVPGTYTYSIDFYPGPGNITVNATNINDPVAGDVEIEKCNENFTDILEQANNTIVCRGLNPQGTIRWTFSRNGLGIPVATCGPTNCTVHQLDHFAVERSPSHSTLFYQQYDRQVDKDATVTCESYFGGSKRSKTCSLNVIKSSFTSSSIAAIVGGCVGGVVVIVVAVVIVVVIIKQRDKSYAKPTRRPRNAEPEHVYNDLHNDTATTTTTTTTKTTPSNSTSNQHRGQGKKSDNVYHNPVYVNENQPGEESSGLQQHPTYANDHPETAQGDVDAYRNSNPYYSGIKRKKNKKKDGEEEDDEEK